MPAYASGTAVGLYDGDVVTVFNQAVDGSSVTNTQAVVLGPDPNGRGNQLTLVNTTNQTATVKVSFDDLVTDFKALTNADNNQAITAASGSSINFTTVGPFLFASFGTAPSSGKVVISR